MLEQNVALRDRIVKDQFNKENHVLSALQKRVDSLEHRHQDAATQMDNVKRQVSRLEDQVS